jgi:hypothetical protein
MPRVALCAGSPALEAQVPKDESTKTDEAQEGDAIHAAIEQESDEGLDEQGKTIADRLRDMEKSAVEQWMLERSIPPEVAPVPQREVRLWFRNRDNLQPLCSAKLDVFYVYGTSALALDHKTGYLPVTAARSNIQMRTQALCLWHEYEHLTHIRVATAQFRFKGRFTASDYTIPDLQRAEQELIFNLWRSEQSDAPRVPSVEACRYCRAKSICPEARALAMLPATTLPRLDVAKKDLPAMVRTMDLPTKAFLRHRKSMIENVLEAVSTDLRQNYSADELAGVGLQLVPSNGVRVLSNVQKLWEVLQPIGVKEHEFRALLKAVHGTTQAFLAEKLKQEDASLTDKEAKERADKILEPAVTKAPREPQLRSL